MPSTRTRTRTRSRFRRSAGALVAAGALVVGVVVGAACTPTAQIGPPQLLEMVNDQRAAAGVGPVSWCPTLVAAAFGHSADQAKHRDLSHIGSDGSTVDDRAERAGYLGWSALGENVASGYPSALAVMGGWMASPDHRDNILDPRFTHMGSGVVTGTDGIRYWTQDFGRGGTCSN